MIFTGNMNLLFRPGLRKNFRDTWDEHNVEYSQFLVTGTTDSPETSAAIITGFSRFRELEDGETITYEDPVLGPKAIAVDKEFGLGFIISRRAIEDDMYGKANQHAKWLARSCRLTYEYRAASLLDDAFTGNIFRGLDQLPLLSTAHTLLNSTKTFANRPTVEVGLSVTGITSLLDLAQNAVDQNGDPIILNPDTLIIGNNAADQNRALQIWNSQLEPFTTENQENALRHRMKVKNGGMPSKTPILSHYKESKTSYFMIDSKYNDAHLDVRRPVEFSDTEDFDTGASKFKGTTRFKVYFFDPIGWFGANPL
jgi:hypothetical protein